MNKVLYVTDLDGTLLNSNIEISSMTSKIINKFINNGGLLTYSTSRSFYTCKKILSTLNFELPCITHGGAFVVDAKTGCILKSNCMDFTVYLDILKKAEFLGLNPFVFGLLKNGKEILMYRNPVNSAQTNFINERIMRSDKRLIRVSEYPLPNKIINLTFLYQRNELGELEKYIDEKYGDTVGLKIVKDIYNLNYVSLEVSHKSANKGKMLSWLCAFLDISISNTCVFGDQMNDLDMFNIAGKRIAVSNADSKLKELSDEIIESNNDDGVANYLIKLI